MAYKYNEKTGEFEDVPMVEKKRKIPTLPDPPPPLVEIEEFDRRNTWGNCNIPHVPTRTVSHNVTSPPTTTHQPSRTSSSNSFLESLGGIIVGILPYAIGILFVATCS